MKAAQRYHRRAGRNASGTKEVEQVVEPVFLHHPREHEGGVGGQRLDDALEPLLARRPEPLVHRGEPPLALSSIQKKRR
jgi:hypothetical protein